MENLLLRLLGLILSIVGGALLAYLARVFYGDLARWSSTLVHIGMPMMFLLTLAGFCLAGGGLALALRRHRQGPAADPTTPAAGSSKIAPADERPR